MELVPKLMKHVQTYGKLTDLKKLVIKMINHIIDITDTPLMMPGDYETTCT